MEHKTLQQTADEIGIHRNTAIHTVQKTAFRELLIVSLEQQGFTVESLAAKLIQKTEAKRMIGKKLREVDDNKTQMSAVKELTSIYGVHSEKNLRVQHSVAGASDAELDSQIEDLARDFGVDTGPGEAGRNAASLTPTQKRNRRQIESGAL